MVNKDEHVSNALKENSLTCGSDFITKSVYKMRALLECNPTRTNAAYALTIDALTLEVKRGHIVPGSMSVVAMRAKNVMVE